MKTISRVLIVLFVSITTTAQIDLVTLPASESTQVTIYNSKDLTLVRDTRRLTLKKGLNTLQFGWENTLIDPTSISIRPLEQADKIDIMLLSFPARVRQIGRWEIISEIEGAVPFEITYFASGLSWRAFYMGTMNEDETQMALKGYVNVSNHSGQDYINTQTRVIIGQTRLIEEIPFLAQRHYPYGPDIITETEEGLREYNWRGVTITNGSMPPTDGLFMYGLNGNADFGGFGGGMAGERYDYQLQIKEIEKTGLSEYFLYTIEGTENLKYQWTKRLPSLDVTDIPVKSLYKYDDNRYGKHAVRFISFANDAEHELGKTPIPEGNIKIYRNVNEQQNLSYIGQSNIKYIPVNEDIELNLGPARLVKVEPTLMSTRSDNYTFDKNGNINGWDDIESYKVTITNTRDIPIDIEITWNMGTDAWELDINKTDRGLEYEKHDKNRARFKLSVSAQSEKVFEHTIRKYREKRIEAYVEKMQEKEK